MCFTLLGSKERGADLIDRILQVLVDSPASTSELHSYNLSWSSNKIGRNVSAYGSIEKIQFAKRRASELKCCNEYLSRDASALLASQRICTSVDELHSAHGLSLIHI